MVEQRRKKSRLDRAPALYDTVIERQPRKTRYSSISVHDAFLVATVGAPAPITISRQPPASPVPFSDPGDVGMSIQLRLDGYALAPLRWFRDRGIDPVAMRDESRQYRETYFSRARRLARRWPELAWRIRHPSGKRAVDVEAI